MQSLVGKLNRHGSLILKSSNHQKEKPDQELHRAGGQHTKAYKSHEPSLHDIIKYDDLEKQNPEKFDILEIQDTKKYFETHSTTVKSDHDLIRNEIKNIEVDEPLDYTSLKPQDLKLQLNNVSFLDHIYKRRRMIIIEMICCS